MDPGVPLAMEWRNDLPQAVHTGHAVVLDSQGAIEWQAGNPDLAHFWRSSAKPLQALPFAEIARELGLGDEEISVACGSHEGQQWHLDAVRRILEAADIPATALQCGIHDPGPIAVPRPPEGWQPIHNNCSGKHAAMLAVCKTRGYPLHDYLEPAHPLQRDIRTRLARATGLLAEGIPMAVDGCGLPTFHLPLVQLAKALRWMALGGDPAGPKVLAAIARHPLMVAGTGQVDSDVPVATSGAVVGKYGAMAIQAFVHIPTARALAVRCTGGNPLAVKTAALDLAAQAGWLGISPAKSLEGHLRPVLRNHAGKEVGRVEPVFRMG